MSFSFQTISSISPLFSLWISLTSCVVSIFINSMTTGFCLASHSEVEYPKRLYKLNQSSSLMKLMISPYKCFRSQLAISFINSIRVCWSSSLLLHFSFNISFSVYFGIPIHQFFPYTHLRD